MKKVFYLSLVAATSLMAKSVLLQSIDVVATEPKKYDGNSTIKQGEFMGSSVYDRGYLDRTLSGNGDISEIIKRNPNARTSLGTRTSKNQGEILPQNISINAASVYQNSFLLDGVGINNDINPLGGDIKTGQAANRTPFLPNPSQGLNIDTSLLKEIEVMDSSVSAKYGGFQGGVVKASTRDPRQGFHGKIHFSHTRDSWQKTHIDDSEIENFEYSTDTALYQPDFKKYKAGIILEGFVDENFGLLFNYNQTKSKIYQQYYPQDYDIDTSKVGEKRKLSRKNENFFLKGVWYVNDRLTIRPSISYAPYEGTYYSINGVNAGARVEGGGLNTALESEYLGRWGIYTQTFSYSKQEMSRKTDSDRMFVWQRSLKNEGQGSRRFSTFFDAKI